MLTNSLKTFLIDMNCSKQIRHLPYDIPLARKTRATESYERTQTRGLATKKLSNQFAGEEPSPSCYRETGPPDFNMRDFIGVLQAYGIIPAEGCISSCCGRTVDLTMALATAPSNVKAIIAGFLG